MTTSIRTATGAAGAALLALLLATPLAAQTELERLGGGPGGVPQWPGGQQQFFQERSGVERRPRAPRPRQPGSRQPSPHQAGQQVVEETEDAPLTIGWRSNLLSVAADGVPASIFFLELNRVTGIPVRLDPGNERTVTAQFKDVRLERALATILPAGQCVLVRREGRAPNAPDSILGIVVKTPPPAPGEPPRSKHQVVGAIHFGPHFEAPGEPAAAPAPAAVAEEKVDPSETWESASSGTVSPADVAVRPSAAPVTAAAPATIAAPDAAPASTAPAQAEAARDADEVHRRMKELVEQRLKKKSK